MILSRLKPLKYINYTKKPIFQILNVKHITSNPNIIDRNNNSSFESCPFGCLNNAECAVIYYTTGICCINCESPFSNDAIYLD